MSEHSHLEQEIPILIIVGPPRSGTSLLGRILGLHPQVATWIEPYFVWDRDFRDARDDCRTKEEASERVRQRIRSSFKGFMKAFKAQWVVDKSPRSCLRLPFVEAVFPEAKYLFLIRDGRDAILSMAKQWEGKKSILEGVPKGERGLGARFSLLKRWMWRQPSWSYRVRALWFEMGPPHGLLRGATLSRTRWGGRFGWGPRFRGWDRLIDQVSPLEFSAHQWAHCARGVVEGLGSIASGRRHLVRYEDLISDPEAILADIFAFMGLGLPQGLMDRVPKIMSDNFGKWKREFTQQQLMEIGPVVQGLIEELGYAEGPAWFQGREMLRCSEPEKTTRKGEV